MKFLLVLLLSITSAFAQKVITVKWPTQHASPPSHLESTHPNFAKLLRMGLKSVPEPLIMQFAGYGGAKLGLNKAQAETLQNAIASYYQSMANQAQNNTFPAIPSALSYCYVKEKPTHGLATVYMPKVIKEKTRTILFLHGYGGSFSYYLHYLATTFPDAIIICPAYGISMAKVPDNYLHECLKAIRNELKHSPLPSNKPILIGLSAGGTGGFRHYARNTNLYERFLCMASLPPKEMTKPMPGNSLIRLIAGGNEGYVKSKLLEHRIQRLKIPNYQQTILQNQGHFFMLTDEERTKKLLRLYSRN